MRKPIMTTGSGMTEQAILRFDWGQPGDAEVQVKAAIETLDRSSFARLTRRLAELATAILDEAGLPADPEGEYLVTPDGEWALIIEEMELGPDFEDARLSLEVAVMLCGYPHDSPEGYAARVLMTLRAAQEERDSSHLDEAMALAFAAGELVNEAAMKGVFEPDVLRGEKVRVGGKEGNRKAYGSEAEKAARQAAYLAAFDHLRAQGMDIMEAYAAVAKRFGVSARTIRRTVEQRNSQA